MSKKKTKRKKTASKGRVPIQVLDRRVNRLDKTAGGRYMIGEILDKYEGKY